MIRLRKSKERGFFNHGWLQTYHSFSFANYYDPQFMGWGNLRVINEDWIAPGMGFGTHGHRDMEIVTYVLEGELAHKDSMGNAESIPPGDVQRMSAGTGVMHSEFNHAQGQQTHLLQIWIEPNRKGVAPGYEQKAFPREEKQGRLRLVASPNAQDDSVMIHADAKMYVGLFNEGQQMSLEIDPARKAYVHLIRGEANINGHALQAGDALMFDAEKRIDLQQAKNAEVLVFDLAA